MNPTRPGAARRPLVARAASFAALLLLVVSCAATDPDGGPPPPGGYPGGEVPAGRSTELEVPMQRDVRWGAADLTVAFTRVQSDSRCPIGTNCVWAGNAIVDLTATRGGRSESFSLRLGPAGGDGGGAVPDAVDRLGMRFEVVQLRPEPEAGRSIDQLAYRVLVRVTAL